HQLFELLEIRRGGAHRSRSGGRRLEEGTDFVELLTLAAVGIGDPVAAVRRVIEQVSGRELRERDPHFEAVHAVAGLQVHLFQPFAGTILAVEEIGLQPLCKAAFAARSRGYRLHDSDSSQYSQRIKASPAPGISGIAPARRSTRPGP